MERLPADVRARLQLDTESSWNGQPCWKFFAFNRKVPVKKAGKGTIYGFNGEADAHRVLYMLLRSDERIYGYGLTNRCGKEYCVNPFHYFRGVMSNHKALNELPTHYGMRSGNHLAPGPPPPPTGSPLTHQNL
jgi:hypothetical protein